MLPLTIHGAYKLLVLGARCLRLCREPTEPVHDSLCPAGRERGASEGLGSLDHRGEPAPGPGQCLSSLLPWPPACHVLLPQCHSYRYGTPLCPGRRWTGVATEDDGRLPRGGEGASSLHWSLAKRLQPSFFRHTRSSTEKSGRAEMSQGHIKKKKSSPVCFAFICKSVPLPGILIWIGS